MALSSGNTLLMLVVTLIVVWLPVTQAIIMQVFFNYGDRKFYIDTIQRCYSITYCFDGQSRNSQWKDLPEHSQIVWFSDEHCQGNSIHSARSKGSISFKGDMLYNKVSSFMVRLYSWYAVNGVVDYCHEVESGIFNSTNTSSVSNDARFATINSTLA